MAGCGRDWPVCLFDMLGYGLVGAVAILNNAMLASVCLSGRFEDPSSARCVVHSAWLCAPVWACMSALKAAFRVAVFPQVAGVYSESPRGGRWRRLDMAIHRCTRSLGTYGLLRPVTQ